jgi:hypothetical protein
VILAHITGIPVEECLMPFIISAGAAVLGMRAAEAADVLGTTPASVNSALLRARGSFRRPGSGAPTCWPASNCLPCCSHEPGPEAATAQRGRDDDFAAAP